MIIYTDNKLKPEPEFLFTTYMGSPIHKFDTEVSVEEIQKLPMICDKNGIKDGDLVFVAALRGWLVGTFCSSKSCVETAYSIFSLEFDKDDRHCWVSLCQINKKALEKVNFT